MAKRTKNGTQEQQKHYHSFWNYDVSIWEAELFYQESEIILHNHSGAVYIVTSETRPKAGEFIFKKQRK